MDVSGHLDVIFLKPADLPNGETRRVVISEVKEGRFEKPDIYFQDDTKLGLNATNMKTLAAAYGVETDDWIGKEVELYVGQTEYEKVMRESVLIRTISPPLPPDQKKKLTRNAAGTVGGPARGAVAGTGKRNDMDDEIPF